MTILEFATKLAYFSILQLPHFSTTQHLDAQALHYSEPPVNMVALPKIAKPSILKPFHMLENYEMTVPITH